MEGSSGFTQSVTIIDAVDIGLKVGEIIGAFDTGEADFEIGETVEAGTGASVPGCVDGERVKLGVGTAVVPSSVHAPLANVPIGTELQGLESGKY